MENRSMRLIWDNICNISPRRLFLTDCLGALLTTFLLGIVLARFESVFGMPRQLLYPLAMIAGAFSIYSFVCFLRFAGNWRPYLRLIAFANLTYCCLTIGLVFCCWEKLSVWGISYFFIEVAVVGFLSIIELKTAEA